MNLPDDSPETAVAATLAAELRVLLGRFKRRLREQGNSGDFTPSQVAALLCLERDGPTTVTHLAQAEGVRAQSMGATIAVLEAAGLVNGTPDPTDGRKTLLSLSAVCREMLSVGRAAREDWLFQAISQKLSADEHAELARSIRLLKRLLD